MNSGKLVRCVGLGVLVSLGTVVPAAGAESGPVVARYMLRHAWFEAFPVRHTEIHDPVVELERPLSDTRSNAAVIAYSYPGDRRISFHFAWERPPVVLELRRDIASGPYSVALQLQRRYGAEHRDELADIGLNAGGQAVDVGHDRVLQHLRCRKMATEVQTDHEWVGLAPSTASEAASRRFWLSREPSVTPARLAGDLRYAYVRIYFQARGGYGIAYYVYEAMGASSGPELTPVAGVETFLTDGPGSSAGNASLDGGALGGGRALTVPNGGFENGLDRPWGTGQFAQGRAVWWNNGGCQSQAEADGQSRHGEARSLHIVNRSPRGPHVYGTTQQSLAVEPGQRYRITVWARANQLSAHGAVSVIVDAAWKVRPIQLPAGTYDWRQFSGEFTLPSALADLRILSEDRGEVWLDDLQIVALGS
jgi:hypothetical protein